MERLNEITELANEAMFDDFTYYYKNMSMKRFDDFDNAIKLMEKIEDRDMKVEEVKNELNLIELNF